MQIAIDASRTTVSRITGTENYAIQLIRALIRLNTRHHITLYFRDNPAPALFRPVDSVTCQIIPFRRAWTHVRFAAALWRDRPDVTFVPAHTLPIWFPGKALVTVHDLGFRYFPDAHPTQQRRYLDWTTRTSARRATVILADSQATADDLTRFYGTPADKIQVVYPGVEKPLTSPSTILVKGVEKPSPPAPLPHGEGSMDSVQRKYKVPSRYFLFIGTLQPRKNIARIVQAYAQWKAEHPGDTAGLVLAGGKGWLYDDAWTAGVDGVHLPGYIDDADKGTLYAGAVALVFPTLYEGFGFPVLEAMHCGTPVIASNTSSLPELVGDAGLLVDPLDVKAIAAAMGRLASDESLRLEMREKGYQQVGKFTWEKAALGAMEALEKVTK